MKKYQRLDELGMCRVGGSGKDDGVMKEGVSFSISFFVLVFFFKQKTAYEIYQCDWSSDVCSSDLRKG